MKFFLKTCSFFQISLKFLQAVATYFQNIFTPWLQGFQQHWTKDDGCQGKNNRAFVTQSFPLSRPVFSWLFELSLASCDTYRTLLYSRIVVILSIGLTTTNRKVLSNRIVCGWTNLHSLSLGPDLLANLRGHHRMKTQELEAGLERE